MTSLVPEEIISIQEEATTWLPSVRPRHLPADLPQGITIAFNGRDYGIAATGICGTLRLNDGRTLTIHPKIGAVQFLRMLRVIGGDHGSAVAFHKELASYSFDSLALVPEQMVANQLIENVDIIMRRGLQTTRERITTEGVAAEGQVKALETITRLHQRSARPIVSTRSLRTTDTPSNRVITSGLTKAQPFLEPGKKLRGARMLWYWRKYAPAPLDLSGDIEIVQRGLATAQYGGIRGYYTKALKLALMVLGVAGLHGNRGPVVMAGGAIIRTSTVFERYVRTLIRRGHTPLGYVVRKPRFQEVTLYNNNALGLEPDVVMSRHRRILLLADAKYKQPTNSDHYQMLCHLFGFDADVGFMIYPHAKDGVIRREFQTKWGSRVLILGLPLATNLEQAEGMLLELVNHR